MIIPFLLLLLGELIGSAHHVQGWHGGVGCPFIRGNVMLTVMLVLLLPETLSK